MRYLNTNEVIFLHEYLIREFGGLKGLRDHSALESALGRLDTGYYDNIYEKAAALMESLAINHPFVDGNKRVSFFATDIFLRLNGYYIDCDSESVYSFFRALFETGRFKFNELLNWLSQHVRSI